MQATNNPCIVFIDDDSHSPQNEVLVTFLREAYGAERVHLFDDTDPGLKFIKENLGERIIVLLDIMFNGKEKGFDAFKQIINESKLICVIIMTGISIQNVDPEKLKTLINENAWYLITRGESAREILRIIKKADEHLVMRIDGAIEQWVLRQKPEEFQKKFIKSRNGESYSLADILRSIRTGDDPIGQEIANDIMQLAITMIAEDESIVEE